LLASAPNRTGGGAQTLGRGGIPPTPPFRRALASTAKNFQAFAILSYSHKNFLRMIQLI